MSRTLVVGSLALLFGGCFSTSYDLTSAESARRQWIGMAPPPGWMVKGFDDSRWPETRAALTQLTPTDGVMPTLFVRQRFDLGPDPLAYRTLTVHVDGIDGGYQAWINGQLMSADADGAQHLVVQHGAVGALGNVLALAIHSNRAAVAMNARLDGDAHPSGAQIVKGPYLLNPTRQGVTVAWETADDTAARAIVDGVAWDGGSGRRHLVTVTGLVADHAYTYYVTGGDIRSDPGQLNTAPEPGKRLRFVVFGDNRTDGNTHRCLIEALTAEAPDFVINTGDMVGESTGSEWSTFFQIEYPLLRLTPYVPAMGNHEHDYGEDEDFARLFPMTGARYNGRVYSFDYGSAHVALLDSNGDLGDQSRWLESDLAGADARGLRSFVVLHWGPVCGCARYQHGSNDDANVILGVATRHRVAAIFSGHNHLYERGVARGIPYVVTGGGGAPLNMDTGQIGSTRVTFKQFHYVVIDLGPDGVHLSTKGADGIVLDDAML